MEANELEKWIQKKLQQDHNWKFYPNRKVELSIQDVVKLVYTFLTWIDAEKERPLDGMDIIFIDTVGFFKGTYHNERNGRVYVSGYGGGKDIIEWENVLEWVACPETDNF